MSACSSAWRGPNGLDLVSNDEVADGLRAPRQIRRARDGGPDSPMPRYVSFADGSASDGFVGLRVVPWLWGLPPTDRRYYPLFAECVELGRAVLHAGRPHRADAPLRNGQAHPVHRRGRTGLPRTVIVCGHVGYPWTEEMVAVARKHPNVYIDTSAYTDEAAARTSWSDSCAPGTERRKVLFGTNYPMIGHQHALVGLDELGSARRSRAELSARQRRAGLQTLKPCPICSRHSSFGRYSKRVWTFN